MKTEATCATCKDNGCHIRALCIDNELPIPEETKQVTLTEVS